MCSRGSSQIIKIVLVMPISGILLSEKLSRGTDKPGSFSKFPARILALLCIGVPQRY